MVNFIISAQRWLKKFNATEFGPTVTSLEIMACYKEACLDVEKIDFSFMRKKFQRENPRAKASLVNRYIDEKKQELVEILCSGKINTRMDYKSFVYEAIPERKVI